jgi:hypothetical protein
VKNIRKNIPGKGPGKEEKARKRPGKDCHVGIGVADQDGTSTGRCASGF